MPVFATGTSLLVCRNLTEILESAACYFNAPIEFYEANSTSPSKVLTTRQLWYHAQENAQLLHNVPGITKDSVVLIHFDNHEQNLTWMWSAIVGGYLPAMSPSFVNDLSQRQRHIVHLQSLLNKPVVLTSEKLVHEFMDIIGLNIITVESLLYKISNGVNAAYKRNSGRTRSPEDPAVLMLTSGSTGNAKAVVLRHKQLKAAMVGKIIHHSTEQRDVFLAWVALDHVASLCQIHLHALALGARQIFAPKEIIVNNHMLFLQLIHNLRVSVTFAPNFYLAALSQVLDGYKPRLMYTLGLDLSCLKVIFSGGEANTVQTCLHATKHFQALGTRSNVVSPGFGMTETCAGSMHNVFSPKYDIEAGLEFASVGPCIPGIVARLVGNDGRIIDEVNVPGSLQLKGEVVFQEYYNNPLATLDAFTGDGWFITGDSAFIDKTGFVHLCGRTKDMIIVNGANYYPHELETAIEDASIPGVQPTFTVAFAHRPNGATTEKVVIIYSQTSDKARPEELTASSDAISRITARLFGVSPYQIVPVHRSMIPKTTLGKISRSKVAAEYCKGMYDVYYYEAAEAIKSYRQSKLQRPETETQMSIARVFAEMFDVDISEIGTNSSLLDIGVSSIELIRFKTRIQNILALAEEVPMIVVLANPTISGIADAIDQMQQPKTYTPVVALQTSGHKTPLWLVHPGVGEVLVFLNLAKYITDRPLYALRARGFEKGETYFNDLPEIFSTYFQHIKETQPVGPYAIAGYSFGAMIAFEVAKLLEATGDEVKFLGSFNLPPHIKDRMRQLDWVEAGINLAYFLDLFSEEYAHSISPELHNLPREEVLDHIISCGSQSRLEELSMTKQKLNTWISLAHKMQEAALEYEPSGSIAHIDVFHAIPLKLVAKDRNDWIENKLSKWADFSRETPRMHKVDGAHYTMMAPEHVFSFQKVLNKALHDRGI
ncbi:hypothetical protein AJ80_00854 [Polytolypa hystricis UAMH7299]|uniref:Carrier domain-containing protein n=1 Tax=Polytolypa hystricis (strain UAMH7299) TaxID=1447883 RepID=A0A2B7Z0C6_POLH7|nr:hypothetical protein AJ80_00854 [Polytolypa hystricis UAMH7299]